MKALLVSVLLCFTLVVHAASVDTVPVPSASMHKDVKTVIVLPAGYDKAQHYPVIYLLHGYSGNYSNWVVKVPGMTSYADLYHVILVCPDANFGSWYFDSPMDPTSRYETFVSTELVRWTDEHYSTIASRQGRAITGLSMGGHGALYVAFRHQDVFGAAGSSSGGVDIRPFPDNWELAKYLGSYSAHPDNWETNTVTNMLYLVTPKSLALIIDCGTEDFFYKVNMVFHEKLLERNIPHDFITRPGAHDWNYWGNSIAYQLLFFSKFFQKTQPK